MVTRETHTSFCASSTIFTSHTWVERPRCTGRAVPMTQPDVAARTWFALISRPTQ